MKKILFNEEARNKLKKGADVLCDSVKTTLGACGRNVVIEIQGGSPIITKDGVTVAREVFLEDPIENMGAQMIKQVANQTMESAGDGTTTATVLAQSILTGGLKNVAAGANPMDLKRGIDLAVKVVVANIKEQSKPIENDSESIKHIANISSNMDMEVGSLIADAMAKIKKNGIITVEDAKGTETTVDFMEGVQFHRGYCSHYFVTDTKKMEAVLENPYILICEGKLSSFDEFRDFLVMVHQTGRSLVIIADEIEGEVLATLKVNKVQNGFKVVALKAPSFGDKRKEIMTDISVVTGGTYISEESGFAIKTIGLDKLGEAKKVIVGKYNTTIIGGKGTKEDILSRVNEIKTLITDKVSEGDSIYLKSRISTLDGGVAVLYVGASTEVEMKEKKDRIDDALHATRAAVEEGIVAGGGVAYIRAIESLKELKGRNADEDTGINIIRESLEQPLRTIINNSGLVKGDVVIENVKNGTEDFGFNVYSNKYENFLQTGVIDPAKVTRVALENAASISGLIITTECLISTIPQK